MSGIPTVKLVLNGKYLRAGQTGVHRVATELANALADLKAADHPMLRGLEVSMLVPRDGVARAAAIPLPYRELRWLTGIPWEQLTLPLMKGRPLLLNLCNIGPVLCCNAVTMIHDAQVHLSPASYSRPFRWWYRAIQPIFARRHRRILTVSHFSKREIVRAGLCAADKIAVVHNGADHILRAPPDASAIAALGLTPGRYVVAFASAKPHKNIRLLLRAFADPALDDLALVLVGNDGRLDLERHFGCDRPNVRFAGALPDGGLRALIEGALCLAFPSTTEGFGLPPLEAMYLGCPAIVAPCGALPEVCGEAAIYAASDAPDQWVAAIRRLHDVPAERAARAQAGRVHAARFNWHAAALTLVAEIAPFLRRDVTAELLQIRDSDGYESVKSLQS